jgi:sec-independent protein translocase protein TatA
MFGLQPTHLVIILVVALLLIAPSRLPELGRAVRKAFDEFRSGVQEPAKSVRSASSDAREQEATASKE